MADDVLQIEGTVENIVYKNETNGYIVLDLDVKGDMVTVVGELGDIDEGETLVLKGKYINHHKFGVQFEADYCDRKFPVSPANIEKFLSSGIIKGVGAGLARKIVNVFGSQTLDIIENAPHRLNEIKGVSLKKADEIAKESRKIFVLRSLTSFLGKYDIKPMFAMKVYRRFGTDALDSVKKNPYIMCIDGIGLDFSTADKVAEDNGTEKNDYSRIIAGTKYILGANAENGHSCLPYDVLMEIAARRLGISESDFESSCAEGISDGELSEYVGNGRKYIYLPEYFTAEKYIAERINVLVGTPSPLGINLDKMIDDEEKRNGIKYGEKQRFAIRAAVSEKIMVLTGGPGTGKTTTLDAVISVLEKQGKKVVLAAPTGRAAKRMAELTDRNARTIHRLLEVKFNADGNLFFVHNEENPIECDAVIVDEMSMVDCILFEKLLRALRSDCRIILVGDSNQLPSVGAGNLLEDITGSGTVPTVELTEIFRQSSESFIITNSHRIISGEYPDLSQKKSDFFFFSRHDYQKALQLIVELAAVRLPKAYGYSPTDDIQILTPTRKGTLGTAEINRTLQEQLNPPAPTKAEFSVFGNVFRVGDKVMQTQNNYNILWLRDDEEGTGIFNGDIGRILSMNRQTRTALIDFDGRKAEYTFEMLVQLELAYAITVHKSQGCEFEAVIMPVMSGFDMLSYRKLLYTAVTRAKKLLILVGTEEQVKNMVDNDKRTKRCTCLRKMIKFS